MRNANRTNGAEEHISYLAGGKRLYVAEARPRPKARGGNMIKKRNIKRSESIVRINSSYK